MVLAVPHGPLVEAVRPDARLILVGDPEQLASVEAGRRPGRHRRTGRPGACMGQTARAELGDVTGQPVPASAGPRPPPIGDGIVVLRKVHRYGGAIAELAEAIQRGDADAVARGPRRGGDAERRLDRRRRRPAGRPRADARRAPAAVTGSARPARGGPGRRRRCGHRGAGPLPAPVRPPPGTGWRRRLDAARRELAPQRRRGIRHRGRLVRRPAAHRHRERLRPAASSTATPESWSLPATSGLVAAFERGGTVAEVSPTRLAAVDTVYAMTVHKARARSSTRSPSCCRAPTRACSPASCSTPRSPGPRSA